MYVFFHTRVARWYFILLEAVDGEAEPYPGVEFLGITDPEDAGGSPDVPAEGIVPSDGLPVEEEANVDIPAEGYMGGDN